MTSAEQAALQSMTEREIRRAQDMVNQQIRMAHAQKNERALIRLREWEDSYAEEMMRRLLNKPNATTPIRDDTRLGWFSW